MSAVAVGLDVGTTGVKALAVAADGTVVARAESHYGLSQPHPGWSEQAPEDWWAGSEAGDRGARRSRGRRHRPVGSDARPRRARRGRARAAAGDPLERPAHGGRVRRDRVARRPRAADRADRQPRADRLHGAQAAVAAHARARDLRAHPPRPAAQGLRAPAPLRRARDRRGRRLGHAALRRRRAPLLGGRPGRARAAGRLDAALARVARDLRPDARRRPRRRGRGRLRGGGARRRRRATRAGLARARHLRRRLRRPARLPARSAGARARLLPRGARRLARDGRDALGRGLAAVGARHVRPGRAVRAADGGGGGRAGRAPAASSSCRTSRASARRTPTRTPAPRWSA